MKQILKMDSKDVKTVVFQPKTAGSVSITYSNLKNSSYVDDLGTKHQISKMTVTYTISSSDIKHGLLILSDPTDGIGLLNANSVEVNNFKFYDENNNLITLKPNTAYLAVTSLNHHSDKATESVKSGRNTKAYGLAGSSVEVHSDGSLYASKSNDFSTSGGTWDLAAHNNESWDQKGQYEYYGTGLLSLSGSDFNFTFYVQNPDSVMTGLSGSGPWFTFTTVIPQTPEPKRKETSARYHYNTSIVYANRIIFSIILLSSLTCNSLITCKYVF